MIYALLGRVVNYGGHIVMPIQRKDVVPLMGMGYTCVQPYPLVLSADYGEPVVRDATL
jgi:hypothetical protein